MPPSPPPQTEIKALQMILEQLELLNEYMAVSKGDDDVRDKFYE